MKDAVTIYDTAVSSGDTSVISDASLNIKPEFRDPEYTRIAMVNGGSPVEHVSYRNTMLTWYDWFPYTSECELTFVSVLIFFSFWI